MEEVKEFESKIKDLKNYVVLATVNPKKYQEINLKLIKHLIQDKNIPGIYVTLNKPYETMAELFKKNKINTDMIIFIDAVTKTEGNIKKTEDCLFIGNPENLSDISIAMDQAVRSIHSKEKFLFFDSLNTLLIFNSAIAVARFIHFLAGKMRAWGVKGIIISLRRGVEEELINELTQFCDLSLELGGG